MKDAATVRSEAGCRYAVGFVEQTIWASAASQAKNLVAHTGHAPGDGRGRCWWRAVLHSGFTEPGAQKLAENGQVVGPSGQIEVFFKRLVYQKIGFPLEDLGGLFCAAAFFVVGLSAEAWAEEGFVAVFLAAGRGGDGVLFFCAAARVSTGLTHLAGIGGDKKPEGRFPHAVAVDALHAQPDRGGEQGGYPEPNESAGVGCHCVSASFCLWVILSLRH